MINAIDLRKLRNAEFIQFNRNFANILEQKNPENLSVQSQYDVYVQKLNELEELFKNPTSNPLTAEMEELDYQRDEAITGILGIVNAYYHHYDPAKRQASMALQNNLNLYNNGIAKENYQSETAIINNLINDWNTKAELQNAVSILGLTEWATELDNANRMFDQKYIERNQSYASAPTENQKSKREQVMASFYEIRKCMEVFSIINKSAIYDNAISEVNQLIGQYNTLLKGRKTKPVEPSNN